MKKCILLANGQPPKKSVFKYLNKAGYKTLFCADGGADTACKLVLIPDFIIGDFDSVKSSTLKYFEDKSRIIQIKRQNDTDVEKCLKYARKIGFNDVVLLGGTGDRLDHSFCNLGIVLKFSDSINIKVIHEKSLLSVYSGNIILSTIPGETISIYGFDSKTKFISHGLKYPLKNIALPFGQKESTSNVAVGNKVKLNIKNGKAFIIRNYEVMSKNGLI
jgi:thiamine pyrophosphokinase